MVMALGERWVKESRNILKSIERLASMEGGDRLDLVKSARLSLYALQRSVAGWLMWVNNPDVMAEFSLEELKEINETLTKFIGSFVEYDIETTEKRTSLPKRRKKPKREEFYA